MEASSTVVLGPRNQFQPRVSQWSGSDGKCCVCLSRFCPIRYRVRIWVISGNANASPEEWLRDIMVLRVNSDQT